MVFRHRSSGDPGRPLLFIFCKGFGETGRNAAKSSHRILRFSRYLHRGRDVFSATYYVFRRTRDGRTDEQLEEYSTKILILTALAKMLLVNLCISLGWRGGSIFPLIFSGVAAGYAFAAITGIDPNFAVAALTAGLYGYVSRKPVMTVAVLLMCFPPVYIFPLAGAAVIASKVPIPPKMHEEEKIADNQFTFSCAELGVFKGKNRK